MAGKFNKRYLMDYAGELYDWLPAPNEEWTASDIDKDLRGGSISKLKSEGVIRVIEHPETPSRFETYRTVSEAYEYMLEAFGEWY